MESRIRSQPSQFWRHWLARWPLDVRLLLVGCLWILGCYAQQLSQDVLQSEWTNNPRGGQEWTVWPSSLWSDRKCIERTLACPTCFLFDRAHVQKTTTWVQHTVYSKWRQAWNKEHWKSFKGGEVQNNTIWNGFVLDLPIDSFWVFYHWSRCGSGKLNLCLPLWAKPHIQSTVWATSFQPLYVIWWDLPFRSSATLLAGSKQQHLPIVTCQNASTYTSMYDTCTFWYGCACTYVYIYVGIIYIHEWF